MEYRRRIEALKSVLQKEKLDGLLVAKMENIIYLCGFEGENTLLIVSAANADYIISDARFKEQLKKELPDFNIRLKDGSRYNVIDDIARKNRIKKLGFESVHLNYDNFLQLKKRLRKTLFTPKRNLVETLRAVKDAGEISFIKKSISIVKKAYSYAKKKINPKLTGRDLAVLIDNFMRSHGASRSAFQTIVAQNPYSSYPHSAATSNNFGKPSCVVVDMGAVVNGYNSDLTRVIFMGRITAKFKHIYNILKTAQHKTIERIKPGMLISELDRVARQHIVNKGLGKYFIHSLGHGVGLEVHESPTISKKNKEALRAGMVFTIEPGIYIPGWGGLRVEDMVLVTEDGCEVLTGDIPK